MTTRLLHLTSPNGVEVQVLSEELGEKLDVQVVMTNSHGRKTMHGVVTLDEAAQLIEHLTASFPTWSDE